ncbi:glycosyltransferase family 2 protein [Melissococcus plutonius]|uniref:Bactoprenol glucosyl transferase n=1 Tax=Melissococcus plutonius TaxID=33970 RepID=A0A2Z5Y3Z5_9ENTE|nr:glycosyltransferase family 2 protein [Melissococcus plutonius]BAL62606.1 bactoprenol glucosyl transferase [Melissococcus plutonius DAT561]MCV2498531.1 glycosyltransferase family 2 protein [Melissococcus plutonius]MCV2501090.1 glycosyltransferase family 2 protein [Melissococcus plutonius]MCV2504801.1 glycosyltransferase family 2 protein [Melissococcus plutonius]MCV2507261.1 glycosyltransferase family 2 protein [Melissococcus plutonius]
MLSIVVPCYNEEESIPLFFDEVEKVSNQLDQSVEYIFINDGSKDNTLTTLRELYKKNPLKVRYLSFSRNFGKEAGLYAGLKEAKGDLITVMDVDLQDPPELLPKMIKMLDENLELDCIGTRRVTRDGEPPIRSFFARLFYKLINRIGETEMVDGARDFRLMTRQMVDAILELKEYNRFSKGIFSWVGFNTQYLEYENRERVAGETSWSFWSLLSYSIDGIIDFSDAPLNIASYAGAFSCIGSTIAMLIIIFRTLINGDPTSGWPSMVCIFLFVGGIQLLCLGIIGKYIGKIFLETKKRPIYIVKETEQSKKNE